MFMCTLVLTLISKVFIRCVELNEYSFVVVMLTTPEKLQPAAKG